MAQSTLRHKVSPDNRPYVKVRWRASDEAGEAHAYRANGHGTSLCYRPNPGEERHDWPAKSRCTLCTRSITGTD